MAISTTAAGWVFVFSVVDVMKELPSIAWLKLDTHFYVGTIHQHPGEWIVVGLFYPPKVSPTLF